jgi:kynureninase
MTFQFTEAFAEQADSADKLSHFRTEYIIPQHNGEDAIYFCGNSLGLQPKRTQGYLQRELDKWGSIAVEGHFRGEQPWLTYHKQFKKSSAALVGALEEEVVVMNNLTTNLHLLMVSFYRPEKDRYKILTEAGSFPSDAYALETQARFHGYDPEHAIIELSPREGEYCLHAEDILQAIDKHAHELALIMLPGIQYYTGQVMPMEAIAKSAARYGITVGFDLAHAAGNIPMKLHDWGVDFAVWCTYKYLNSGPGSVAGAFVHQNHADNPSLPRFAGWWGHDEKSRFLMKKGFIPMHGADGWQLSNMNILGTVGHLAPSELFFEAGIDNLRQKSLILTAYLEFIIKLVDTQGRIKIITPSDPNQRGAQLSLLVNDGGKVLFDTFMSRGVIGDWREPNVIRLAPTPMYNSFRDVYRFGLILQECLEA